LVPGPEADVTKALPEDLLSHRPAIEAFVLRLTSDPALSEDLTQETMIRASRKAATYRGESSTKSWLYAIALNLVRDNYRASIRRPETPTDTDTLERLAGGGQDGELAHMKADMSRCITEHLLMLPEPQYNVVVLHDLAGLSHKEIAEDLAISIANSRVLLHRGRAAFEDILKENCVLTLGRDEVPCDRRQNGQKESLFIQVDSNGK
jgi:RNA polymerase sigma-70 factor (ECF subfamily)